MSDFDVARWRPAPFLPESDARDGSLTFVVAVLCFLACLTLLAVLAADRAARDWTDQLEGQATIIVRPKANETPDGAAARAAETLAGVDGVEEAAALDRKAAEDLVRPWRGDAVLPDLPLPHLVAVRLNPDAPAGAATLSRALAEAGLDATVDDHSLWRGEVERSAGLITALAGAAFLLIAAATAAAIAYATRAGMAAQASVIETLSLNGASDGYVAGLFQRRFGGLAAQAGALGAGVAALLLGLLRLIGGEGGLTPALPLAFSDLLILIACPLLAFGVAVLAARLTALAKLGQRS